MKKKIVYTDEPMGDVEVVADFLPSPAELAFKEDGVKVTLALSKSSVEFFKSEAAKHQTQYQRMIRRLLDSYVEAQGHPYQQAKTHSAQASTDLGPTNRRLSAACEVAHGDGVLRGCCLCLAQHFAGFAHDIVMGQACATCKLGIGHGVFLDAAFNRFKAIS